MPLLWVRVIPSGAVVQTEVARYMQEYAAKYAGLYFSRLLQHCALVSMLIFGAIVWAVSLEYIIHFSQPAT